MKNLKSVLKTSKMENENLEIKKTIIKIFTNFYEF